jgi:hypothetical protein
VNVEPPEPVYVDLPAVGMRDACHDRQAEPGAWHSSCGGCSIEAFKDVWEVLVGDAGAVIGDRDSAVVDDDAHRGVGVFHLIALSIRLLMA